MRCASVQALHWTWSRRVRRRLRRREDWRRRRRIQAGVGEVGVPHRRCGIGISIGLITHVSDQVPEAPNRDAPHEAGSEIITVMVIPVAAIITAVPTVAPVAVMPVVAVPGSPPSTCTPVVRPIGERVVLTEVVVAVDVVSPDAAVTAPAFVVPVVAGGRQGDGTVEFRFASKQGFGARSRALGGTVGFGTAFRHGAGKGLRPRLRAFDRRLLNGSASLRRRESKSHD